MKIGVIGFGRLGKLICHYLSKDFDLFIHDIVDHKGEIEKMNAKCVSFSEASKCSIIIPLVPISEFESVIKKMNNFIKKDSLVIDICSVKVHPVEVMKKYLPESIQILASHPMFGPDSAADTLFGNKIALCPVRINDNLYNDIKHYLESFGIKLIETTPEEHDKEISSSLLLTHFIGRSLMDFGAKELKIETKGYRRLMKILFTVQNDTWQLFEDMNKFNPYAKETLLKFSNSIQTIKQRIDL